MEMFNLYLIIGGMPAAVEKYRATGSIDDVMDEHRAIIEQYKLDFTQYEEENRRLIISHIYELIPAELNEKNKRFMIADIKKVCVMTGSRAASRGFGKLASLWACSMRRSPRCRSC